MSLKGRIQQARAQLKELTELAESDDLIVWERITQLHKGGMFMGLEQNLEQIRHGIEELAQRRRKGGVNARGIDKNIGEAKGPAQQAAIAIAMKKAGKKPKGVAEGSLNEFAPDGFNGDDDEGFSPEIAKMAQEHGFTKGASLADGATLEMAMKINHWHTQHGGMYKQYFAKGFKAGRMNKIRHNNKQYNLNLKLMKDGSIRHGEQGMAEGFLNEKSTSQAQFRTMAAAAHNPEFAKKVGIKQSVAREFNKADTGQDYKDLPKKANEGATVTTTPGSIEPGGAVDNFKQQMANNTERDMAEGNRKSEPPEADYGDDYQDMVKRVKKLAGVGQLKTQYDPARRVYRNMPTAVQPRK